MTGIKFANCDQNGWGDTAGHFPHFALWNDVAREFQSISNKEVTSKIFAERLDLRPLLKI